MADKYWIGLSGDLASDTTKWSTTSGGANDTTAPVAGDTAHFDSGGNTNCTWDIDAVINITCDSTYTATISLGANINVYGLGVLNIYGTFDMNGYALTATDIEVFGSFYARTGALIQSGVNSPMDVRTGGYFYGGSGNHKYFALIVANGTYFTGTTGITEFNGMGYTDGRATWIQNGDLHFPSGSTQKYTYAGLQRLMSSPTIGGKIYYGNLIIDKGAGNILEQFNRSGYAAEVVAETLTVTSGEMRMYSSVTGEYEPLTCTGATSIATAGKLNLGAAAASLVGVTNAGEYAAASGSITTLTGNFDNTGGSISGNAYISGSAWTLTAPTIAGNIETENATVSGTVTVSSGYLVNKTSKVFDIWGSVAWSDLTNFRFDSERNLTDGDTITVHSGATWTINLGDMGINDLTNDGTVAVPTGLTAYAATLTDNGTITGDLITGNVKRTLTDSRNLTTTRNLTADRNLPA